MATTRRFIRRRRWAPGGNRPRGVSRAVARAINRRSPKKTDRVVVQDTTCAPLGSELVACAPDNEEVFRRQAIEPTLFTPVGDPIPFQLDLVTPQVDYIDGAPVQPLGLETFYVTQIRGWVKMQAFFQWWRPNGETPEPSCEAIVFRDLYNGYRVRAGLMKEAWEFDGDDWEAPDRDPYRNEEWSDLPWLRRYERYWQKPQPGVQLHRVCGNDVIFYPDVDGASVSGSGAVTTELDLTEASNADGWSGDENTIATTGWSQGNLAPPPHVTLSLNMRRRLKFDPADGLALYVAWTNGAGIYSPSVFNIPDIYQAVGWTFEAFVELTIER